VSSTVTAVLAAHNRVAQTLACLDSLSRQEGADAVVRVVLLDDASTDGTAERVAAAHPDATVLEGDGQLFWNGGMRRAFAAAQAGDPDHYLLLNDDVVLDPGALAVLLATAARVGGGRPPIVAGAVRDPVSGATTYGAVCRASRGRPLSFDLLEPAAEPLPADTMHANCTLLPREVVRRVGNLDPAYRHAMGDFDYGLRARQAGCAVWLAPGTVGTCPGNPPDRYGQRPLSADWQRLTGTKGLPPAEWRTFARRWAGPAWPLYWLSPYARRGARMLAARLAGRSASS